MSNSLRNNLNAEHALREARRGGMLDKNRGETGLQQRITVGRQVDLLQLTSENRSNPCVVTVGVDVKTESPAALNGPADVRLQTVISWGCGKGSSSAVVDTRVGSQITVVANILNLAVRYPEPVTPGAGASTVFLVSGIVGYGQRPGAGNPALTFTDELETLAQGGVGVLREIPKYAVAVAWASTGNPTALTAPAAVLRFVGQNAGTASDQAQVFSAPFDFVAIPNGAYFISIRNASGGGAINQQFRLIYELVL